MVQRMSSGINTVSYICYIKGHVDCLIRTFSLFGLLAEDGQLFSWGWNKYGQV